MTTFGTGGFLCTLYLMIGRATGFLLGAAVVTVSVSLVTDIIHPIVGILLGAFGNTQDLYLHIGPTKILWHSIINAIIDSLIIASLIYLAVKSIGTNVKDTEKSKMK